MIAPLALLMRLELLETAKAICRERGVTLDMALGRRRSKSVARARHLIWWLVRQKGLSLPEIGHAFGVDHTTVMIACRAIDVERVAGSAPPMRIVRTTWREVLSARGAA